MSNFPTRFPYPYGNLVFLNTFHFRLEISLYIQDDRFSSFDFFFSIYLSIVIIAIFCALNTDNSYNPFEIIIDVFIAEIRFFCNGAIYSVAHPLKELQFLDSFKPCISYDSKFLSGNLKKKSNNLYTGL